MEKRKRKTILIIAGPMGSGHIRAALALQEIFRKNYPGVRVIYEDSTVWMAPVCRWIFLKLYPFLLAHLPSVWRLIHNSHNSTGKGIFPLIFSISDHKEKKHIRQIVARKKVDLIICTHFYPGYIADEMKKDGKLTIPVALVITDHAGHRIYAREWVDRIFVPNEAVKEHFVTYGIEPEKIRVSGIPVFARFSCAYSETDLLRFCRELNLDPNRYYVMLSMGGWATGDMRGAAKSILKADKDFTLLVMTAHNAELFRQFSLLAADDERIQPVAYTDQMEKYMAICVDIITKPGGLTTSECIAMQKPMLLIDPIAGHEESNLKYLLDQGFGVAPEPGESLTDAGKRLKDRYEEITARMKESAPQAATAASFIAEESMVLLNQFQESPAGKRPNSRE